MKFTWSCWDPFHHLNIYHLFCQFVSFLLISSKVWPGPIDLFDYKYWLVGVHSVSFNIKEHAKNKFDFFLLSGSWGLIPLPSLSGPTTIFLLWSSNGMREFFKSILWKAKTITHISFYFTRIIKSRLPPPPSPPWSPRTFFFNHLIIYVLL